MTQSNLQVGSELLAQWGRLAHLLASQATFDCSSAGEPFRCRLCLPGQAALEVAAPSIEAAAVEMMQAIQRFLLETEPTKNGEAIWDCISSFLATEKSDKSAEAVMENNLELHEALPSHTKARQETIGVSSKKYLHACVNKLAEELGDKPSAVARNLLTNGFDEFESKALYESPMELLRSYENDLDTLPGEETNQWMVRVNRSLFLRMKFTAKEYGKSASQLAAMFMSHALIHRAEARSLVATQEEVTLAKDALGKIKGPAVKRMAAEVGLESYSHLLSGVLTGRIKAPRKLLGFLTEKFNVSRISLMEAFRQCFMSAPLAAYKAENGKPTVYSEPESWESAILSLNLSNDEIERLKEFDR